MNWWNKVVIAGWSSEEHEKYRKLFGPNLDFTYFDLYNAKLIDLFKDSGYNMSLWHYPESNLYEVDLGYLDYDWTNSNVQQSKLPAGQIPRIAMAQKLNQWIMIGGHLIMGSNNVKRVEQYKRLVKRAIPAASIIDVSVPIPGGGKYFIASTTDKDANNRLVKLLDNTQDYNIYTSELDPITLETIDIDKSHKDFYEHSEDFRDGIRFDIEQGCTEIINIDTKVIPKNVRTITICRAKDPGQVLVLTDHEQIKDEVFKKSKIKKPEDRMTSDLVCLALQHYGWDLPQRLEEYYKQVDNSKEVL